MVLRILEVGRDPLFKVYRPASADWVQTGRPIEPINRFAPPPNALSIHPAQALARLRKGEYDLVMVPALQHKSPTDRHLPRKVARAALSSTSRIRGFVHFLHRLLGMTGTPHLIRDVSDFPVIGPYAARMFPEARIFSKREVLASAIGRPAHNGQGGTVTYTPMPFDLARYRPDLLARRKKVHDVFFAGKLHSRERQVAVQVAQELAKAGYRVDIPNERLEYPEYLSRLSQAWLVLSPKGHGEHCYRHYEALLMGSVPVINEPLAPVHYSLKQGVTALFVPWTVSQVVEACRLALEHRDNLLQIAAQGLALVEEEHDTCHIADTLIRLTMGYPL